MDMNTATMMATRIPATSRVTTNHALRLRRLTPPVKPVPVGEVMNTSESVGLPRQLAAVLAGVVIFTIVGPVAGSNLFGLITLFLFAYLFGLIPAFAAGVVFSVTTLWLFKDNKQESSTIILRIGAFRGGFIGLLAAFLFYIIVFLKEKDVVDFSAFAALCGILGGAASGHLAEKAMKRIYFGFTRSNQE